MCGFCDRKSGAWKTAYSTAGTWDRPPETSGNPLPDSSLPDSLRRLVFLDLKMLDSFAKRRVQFLQIPDEPAEVFRPSRSVFKVRIEGQRSERR